MIHEKEIKVINHFTVKRNENVRKILMFFMT